jgi:UPF0755 protein
MRSVRVSTMAFIHNRSRTSLLALLLLAGIAGCGGEGEGEPMHVRIPPGSSFNQVVDTLEAHGIVRAPALFRVYGRVRGAAPNIRPGTYAFRERTGWDDVLAALQGGRVLTTRVTIPEGWDIGGIAMRIAAATPFEEEEVLEYLRDESRVEQFEVPGPTLEGYLYPATYTFPIDVPLELMVAEMVQTYRRVWTPERRARADSIGMNEREVVTLASIVEKEARIRDEMPTIAGVFHNRLRIGMPLQADPTVQYALGVHRERLLYASIDSVADNPYNTYRHRGLPPGPIASPSALGIDATLNPLAVDYLYFVARYDGSHVFTRTLAEHNRARVANRREAEARARGNATPAAPGVP